MKKISTLLVFTLLLTGISLADTQTTGYTNTNSYDNAVKEYNFENNSYNISDEQLQTNSGMNTLQEDKKASFWSKIVNSSHFSSNTATRTWIPLRKSE